MVQHNQNSPSLDLSMLDLSIVAASLPPHAAPPSSGFWKAASCDENMAILPRKIFPPLHVETKLFPEYDAIAQKIAEKNQNTVDPAENDIHYDSPAELDDQLAECTPQFILRNIPKIERYYDLDRTPPFDISDMPLLEAQDILDEAHHTHLGKVEFIPVESVQVFSDFATFLEEILTLCPWDQITRQTPDENNPWNLKYSTTQFARDLVSRKNTLFIFSEKGMTTMQMKDYKPQKEKPAPMNEQSESVFSYGPG